ncbi:protein unc-93 homolog A [Nephila pilipes]|uniref:Protein unc-93 homolog A n=1 Tax=Nephila pilipes TaxID=299642 RepID=A0A8X6PR71_NEPPI|nr:protein unc-93 homolog A [Nephila pilipes]
MKSQTDYSDSEDKICATKNHSIKNSKWRIIKNLLVISVGVLLLFIAFDGLTMLQSTMNREEGIGVASQAILYTCYCICALLLPKYVIKKLGSKITLVLSMFMYIPYIASNFYPQWGLVIPTAICIGLGAPLLWASQEVYLNHISIMYADIIYENKKKYSVINSNSKANSSNSQNMKNSQNQSLPCDSINVSLFNKEDGVILQHKYETSKCCSISPKIRPNSEGASSTNLDDYQYLNVMNLIHNNYRAEDIELDSIDYKGKESCFHENKHCCNIKNERRPSSILYDRRKIRIVESITARFFGIHGMVYLSCHIWSNFMTYYVLKSEVSDYHVNHTNCMCGADYCNTDSACFEQNIEEPSDRIRYILTGACVCIGIISTILIYFFLDTLETEKEEIPFSVNILMATYKLAKRNESILLIPFSFYTGMVQGFYIGDFTKSFIGCAWGTYNVGLVTVCYGTLCGMSASIAGLLVKQVGRIPVLFFATVVNIAASIFLLYWKPSAEEPVLFFVAAGLWGLFVGTVWSQLRAFYGVIFKEDEEAAFAAFHTWYSLGFVLSFAYSNHFCTSVKIYILMVICTLGFFGYVIVEVLQWRKKHAINRPK